MRDNDSETDRKNHGHWRREGRLGEKIERLHRMQLGQRGFLRPKIIELFEQEPMNGVDIMNKLQEMSHGWYRPSPGSIYPLLDQLVREGLIAKNKDGKFELTAAYSEQSDVGDDVSSAVSALESNTSFLEDLQRADLPRLSKSRERLERLAKRLEALNVSLETKGGQS